MAPRYTTVDAVQLALRTPTSASSEAVSWKGSTFTAQLTRVVETAERLIDEHCGWAFDTPANDAVAESKVIHHSRFEVERVIHTPPVSSATDVVLKIEDAEGVKTDLSTRDWDWLHYGDADRDAWRHVVLRYPMCGPIHMEAVWGWPVIPSAVVDAAVQWAAHIFVQESTPLGAQAFDFGAIHVAAMPRGVMRLLRDYKDTAMDVFV